MLHSRSNNNKIKHLHERCLRIIYNDKQSSYEELLIKDGTVSIHHRNIQTLATEMLKVKNELFPEIICDIFTQRINNHYILRHINHSETPFVGTESVSNLGPNIWDMGLEEYKTLNSLNSFKESIKNWVPINCPCRLCKTYAHGVGFLEGEWFDQVRHLFFKSFFSFFCKNLALKNFNFCYQPVVFPMVISLILPVEYF